MSDSGASDSGGSDARELVGENMVVQRREWMANRVGWAVMVVVVVAGLAGLLGSGPLSGAEVTR